MDNANAITGSEWELDEFNPKVGLIWNASESHTFRIASFKYLLPFITARLDPVEIAGIAITRNTEEGAVIEESDIVWDYEWSRGLVSTKLFTLEKEMTQGTAVSTGEADGFSITLNQLLTNQIGLSFSYQQEDIEDQARTTLDRKDQLATLGIKYQLANGFDAGIKQIFRRMSFTSNREEEANITDIEFGYEFSKKSGKVSLEVLNVFDREFNWVTDPFIVNGRAPAMEALLTVTKYF
jgi:hypothetical protein